MKLIYIYFDFTDNGHNPEGYRGFKKCGFNFGTKEYFKMEEPTEKRPNYRLTCTPRPEDEQIEPGFWGDERLYNISALVGDNGVGKSTIIQEIIRCVMGSSKIGKTKHGEDYMHYRPFVSVWENTDGMYMVYRTIIKNAKNDHDYIGFAPSEDRLILNYRSQQPRESFFDDIKFIYFSNVLTESDTRLLADLGGPCFDRLADGGDTADYNDPYYTQPFYNCSLAADMVEANKISSYTMDMDNRPYMDTTPSITRHILETYFNFSSYQEARFLFDRNQRKQLLDLQKNHHFPVPVPTLLTLHIFPALERIHTVVEHSPSYHDYISDGDKKVDFNYVDTDSDQDMRLIARELHEKSKMCFNLLELRLNKIISPEEQIISSLCMNCIASLYISSGNIYFPMIDSFSGKNALSYKNLLDEILKVNQKNNKMELDNEVCEVYKQYFDFLWNNKEHIQHFFHLVTPSDFGYPECTVHIPLGQKIDEVLTEFMIQFINFNRIVCSQEYFITYNWGLSSGERTLLHIFTKLRYLLFGNRYDTNLCTDFITCENAKKASLAERFEYLTNDPADSKGCDSVLLLFDEADLTLHPEWQRQFVSILAAYLPMLYKDPYYEGSESSGCKDIQIILSTHSPIMLGDFPSASVIYLKKDKDKNVITVDDQSTLHTFGQNIYTILKEGFYLGEGTVGELARQKIKAVMKTLGDIQNPDTRKSETPDEWRRRLETHQKQTIRHLPKGIIRNKLEEEIAKCRVILGEKTEDLNPDYHLLMQTNKKLLEENIRLQKQLEDLKNEGQKHDQN